MKPKKLIISALLVIGLLTSLVSAVEYSNVKSSELAKGGIQLINPDPWVMKVQPKINPDPWVLNVQPKINPDPWV